MLFQGGRYAEKPFYSDADSRIIREEFMSCPYFKEGYFGICVAPDAIHVPSIKEMEKFCFRSWFRVCPNISLSRDLENSDKSCAANTL